MIKDVMAANETVKPKDRKIAVLKEYFPSCFKDGNFDMELFSEYLKDKVDITHEGYELNFLGKSYAKLLASLDTETVIIPDEDHNSKPENAKSKNVYISGDNLDGLKHLLKSYSGAVKCIYIDPPYNTGKDDFAYNDKFNFTVTNLVEKLSIDEEQAQRILDLTKRGSASHSAWLMFMYPRLQLARDLLSEDGVIFISIDDNEQANLKLLCDEVFGEDNAIGTIVWNNATDNNPTNIATEHEYIICYAKSRGALEPEWKSNVSDVKDLLISVGKQLSEQYPNDTEFQEAWSSWYREHKAQLSPLDRYKYIDRDGVYTGSQSVHNPGKEGYRYDVIHPVTGKPCVQPLMGYRFPQASMKELLDKGKILFGDDENKIIELKVYANEYHDKFSSVYTLDGRLGAYDIKALFPGIKQLFKNPKPVQLVQRIISFVLNSNDIFLDFFSGSGTSAESLMRYNASQHTNIRYILVQLQEKVKIGSDADKAGFSTIDQIGIERIIRAAKKIREEHPNTTADLGFKHYTLQDVSQNTLDKIEKFEDSKFITDDTIYNVFGVDTVLTTWLVHDGYGFSNHMEIVNLAGYTAYWCDKHLYLVNPGMTNEAIAALIDKYNKDGTFNPVNVIVFGYSFNYVNLESLKTNVKILKDSEKNLKINLDIRY